MNEEQWPLREVVFVEDVKNVPVGKVGAGVQVVQLDPVETKNYKHIIFLHCLLFFYMLNYPNYCNV